MWWQRYVYRHAAVDAGVDLDEPPTRWEMDYGLAGVDRLALLDEYLEMSKRVLNFVHPERY